MMVIGDTMQRAICNVYDIDYKKYPILGVDVVVKRDEISHVRISIALDAESIWKISSEVQRLKDGGE